MVPRSFLSCCINSWATSTLSTQAYTSSFLPPTKPTPSVPFKKSLICPAVSTSLFCMRICIQPQNTRPVHPIFMIILYWNQAQFHDHLVLDNSIAARASRDMVYWLLTTEHRNQA